MLTAADGAPPTVYEVTDRKTAAVAAFAQAIQRAIPVRDPDERRDGARLVTEEALPPRGRFRPDPGASLVLVAVVAVAGLYLTGLVTLIWHGDILGALLFVLGVKPLLAGVAILCLAAAALYDRVILRARGISVLATFHRNDGKKRMFTFTDARGVQRFVEPDSAARAVGGSPQRVRVTYDPRKPERAAAALPVGTWIARTLGVVLGGLPLLALGLFLVPYQVVELLWL
ncbi:hypothetical protein ACWC10_15495 [Streptomyces sp. NPDC001595]|uniref:hypothetical protein n=1 Tax=Streptomyces sp. NPDC001532 TaxID=3154520 RepID=UPI00331834A2